MPRSCPNCGAPLQHEAQDPGDQDNPPRPEHWWCTADDCEFEEEGELQPMSLYQRMRKALHEDRE